RRIYAALRPSVALRRDGQLLGDLLLPHDPDDHGRVEPAPAGRAAALEPGGARAPDGDTDPVCPVPRRRDAAGASDTRSAASRAGVGASGHSALMNQAAEYDWHLLGAGAMGQLWAALLHRARRSICLLLRDEERMSAYRAAGGITLHEEHGATLVTPPALVADASVPVRRLLVATKAHQTTQALPPFTARPSADISI